MTTTDRYRQMTAAAVLIVAAIAAVVSYLHIVRLALAYGQEPVAAYLLPLSIDGMVAASSLVMLRAARTGVSTPWLARTGLVLAVAATLGANIAAGLAHGWPGAVLSGWPAVAFVVSAETAISMSRRKPPRAAPAAMPPAAPAERAPRQPATPSARKGATPRQAASAAHAGIRQLRQDNPGMTQAEIGRRTGTSERTVNRVLNARADLHSVGTG